MYKNLFAIVLITAGMAVLDKPDPVRAEAWPVSSSTSRDGIRLTISLQRDAYPKDALVMARLQLQNRSSHPAQLYSICQSDGSHAIAADVVDTRGDAYPSGFGASGCPPPTAFSLAPGRRIVQRQYVILGFQNVQGVAHFVKKGGPLGEYVPLVATIKVKLATKDPPHLTLRKTRNGLALGVDTAFAGPILYSEWVMCTASSSEGRGWVRASHARIKPLCAFVPFKWKVLVGQLDHSVAFLTYP